MSSNSLPVTKKQKHKIRVLCNVIGFNAKQKKQLIKNLRTRGDARNMARTLRALCRRERDKEILAKQWFAWENSWNG